MHRAPFSRKHQDTVNRKLQVRVMAASSTAPAPWTCRNLMPPPPTPMSQMSSCSSQSQDPFKVCFKVGNVAVCNGCRNTFSQADKIVVQHAEFLHFDSPALASLHRSMDMCTTIQTGSASSWQCETLAHSIPEDIIYQEFSIEPWLYSMA